MLTQSSVYTEHIPALPLIPPHHWTGWGCQDRTADQLTKGYPTLCGVMLSNKSWGNRKEEEDSQRWCLSSQVTATTMGAWFSWRGLNTCLSISGGEWISYFVLLVCVSFALLIKLSLSQPTRFSSSSLPHSTAGKWMSDCMGLNCQLGLNHNMVHLLFSLLWKVKVIHYYSFLRLTCPAVSSCPRK